MGDKKDIQFLLPRFIYYWHTHIYTPGRLIFKWTLNKLKVGAYYEYNCCRTDASGRLGDRHGDEPLDFITRQEFLDELRDYQLSGTELLSSK
jgi:hypothetical protein